MATVQLFSGGLTKIDAEGQWTGIYKQAISGPVQLTVDGLAGDMQADRRVHGPGSQPRHPRQRAGDRAPAGRDRRLVVP